LRQYGGSQQQPRRYSFHAVIFDLDGVVTDTARIHSVAWKALFDDYLRSAGASGDPACAPFDIAKDYPTYVDGKPRYEGVRSFLTSRGFRLEYGNPGDPPEAETICGLGNRKDRLFTRLIHEGDVVVFESTVRLIHALAAVGVPRAVASSSRNCETVLRLTGLADLFDTRVDGVVSAELKLRGKPHPDIFLRCAEGLGVKPEHCVVMEDAISGVEAGRDGRFGLVVGVDRVGQGGALSSHGADVVVTDLSDVSPAVLDCWWLARNPGTKRA